MPYPTGQPFNTLFQPRRFDLVYGRATARSRYLSGLPRDKKAGMREAFVTLDEYNNSLGLSGAYQFATPVDAQRFANVAPDRVRLDYPTGRTGPAGQNKAGELTGYTQALLGSRYSPATIAGRSDQELAGEGFHARVRDGYLQLAAADPARWVVVDAGAGEQEVADAVLASVRGRLCP